MALACGLPQPGNQCATRIGGLPRVTQLLGMKPISACLGRTWVPPYELPAEEETEAWEEVWGTRR